MPKSPASFAPLISPAKARTDKHSSMIHDLRNIIDGWAYEPGKISVRKIIGRDGREKIQTRVDLGLLQFETEGRPDGQRPFGVSSLLEYHEQTLAKHIDRNGSDAGFYLASEECRELRHEAHLYYQRYLSQFVLEDFADVERDTTRSLRLIDFLESYAEAEEDRESLSSQRGYVTMMNTRARTYLALNGNDYDRALHIVEDGMRSIEAMVEDDEALIDMDCSSELEVLANLRQEILGRMPADAAPRLEWELQAALDCEDYERAASLRDQIARARGPRKAGQRRNA
ncbi:MAG: UvrB/UvrC motif-containing protein [Phycisphaerales bacterium]|nr:UvrB/UvrC motif-containing protein [Phycisphaerales bacterium]